MDTDTHDDAPSLSRLERETWDVMLPTMLVLPGALDTQMQRHHGLTYSGYLALAALASTPDRALRMRLLAGRTSMSMSRLSHLADRLERSGLIERRTVADDRRSTLAVLTEAGRAKVDAARGTEATTLRSLAFGRLSVDQVRLLREAFTLISSRMDPEERGTLRQRPVTS